MDKVSCIVPVYNAEEYLRRSLDSICSQTYSNLEIVLVDDGSTDNSALICEEYAACNRKIKVIHIPNGGASLARKKGLEISTGNYVTFIDSDDYVACDYVECLYRQLRKSNLLISACKVQKVKQNEEFLERQNKFNERVIFYNELMPRFFKYEFWGLCGKLYKKDIFIDIKFPKATLSEDYVVMAQLFQIHREIVYSDKPLYFYEYHENSLSHQFLSKRAFEEFENVLYVLELTKIKSPQYIDYALSNVVETSLKLLMMEKNEGDNQYVSEIKRIHNFIKRNFWHILMCKVLLRNVKLLVLSMFCFPNVTFLGYKLLKGHEKEKDIVY